jgi:O-antigen ligase
VPFCIGVAVLLAVERPAIGRNPARVLDWSLLACLIAVAAQLIPLSATARGRLSPQAFDIDNALRLDAAPRVLSRHALSVDVESTAGALALGAAYIGLFWSARAIFARGGVRTVTRGVTWFGLALTVLVAVQRATSPKMLYWYFRPLNAGASPYGPFVSRNALATWLAMAVPLVIGYAMARHRSDTRTGLGVAARVEAIDAVQLWLGAAACLMMGGLFGSMSRAGIIGAAVGLLVFIALSRTQIESGRRLVWISGALAALIAAASLFANFGALAMRLQATTDSGVWGRRAIWRDTWRMTQDFWLTGVGAGAFERGMLVYQEGSRQFFFNHAHDEYLQLAAEGGLLLAVPAAIAVIAGVSLIVDRLRRDRTPIFWLRVGAVSAMIAVAVQSIWDTGLRTPANGALFALIAAVALHEPRPAHEGASGRHGSQRRNGRPAGDGTG